MAIYTTLDFISQAKSIHAEKYSYEKTIYHNSKSKIVITCSVHGDFIQTPNGHLSGYGCKMCGITRRASNKRMNLITFIHKANIIHGEKYGYELVRYSGSKHPVKIICPTHGEFFQIPNSHLSGRGCPRCANKDADYTALQFIPASQKIHGNTYSYNNTIYVSSTVKVIITCAIHGDFKQSPNSHLSGQGCPKCKISKVGDFHRSDTSSFIKKATEKHGSKYKYDRVVYTSKQNKVVITCPAHGDFKQTPNDHLGGHGCALCNSSKGELKIKTLLVENQISHTHQYIISSCRNIRPLPFDFAIFNKDELLGLIEFQGIQHFKEIPYWNGKHGLVYIQNNDYIKYTYCHHNNIPLLLVKYDCADTESTVKDFLKYVSSVRSTGKFII